VEETCSETRKEFSKYRKKTEMRGEGVDSVLDEPANPRLFDAMASVEYFAAFIEQQFIMGQAYVDPSQYASRGSEAYLKAQKIMEKQNSLLGVGTEVLSEQQSITANIATAAGLEAQARETTLQMSRDNRDYLRDNKATTKDTADEAVRNADAWTRAADEAERAELAARRLGSALGNAARDAAAIALGLGGD
jgi:hypothetical protein